LGGDRPPMGQTYSICVAGFYDWPEFWGCLKKQNHDVKIISHSHRKTPFKTYCVENIGLEWHCYNEFVQKYWEGGDVLFLHDDCVIYDNFFNEIETEFDTTYWFKNKLDEQNSQGRHPYGRHGRAVYCKAKIVYKLKSEGIWFDSANTGFVYDDKTHHYNDGIVRFDEQCSRLGSIGAKHHKGLELGWRGEPDTRKK